MFSLCHGWPLVRRILRAFALVLLAATGLAAAQTEPSLVWPQHGNVAAHSWADASGAASVQAANAAFQAGQGRPADFGQIMPLGGGRAVWYRLQFPAAPTATQAVFAVPFAGMDRVDLFRPDGAGGWRAPQRAGDAVPVDRWPMRYLHPAFALTLQPGETQPTYLRVQHSHPIGVSWVLWDASSFNESSKLWHLALGASAGFILLVIVLGVANTFSWRDPIHLYYAVHVALVGLGLMSLTGMAGEYLWPGNAWWNDIAAIVVPAASLGGMGLLLRELVAERGRRVLSRILLAHVGVSMLFAIGFLVVGRDLFRAGILYGAVSLLFFIAVLAWYAWRRPIVGLWVLSGYTLLVAGSLFPLLRSVGLLPITFATQYGAQIGGALEIPLVLIGLYFRSRERRDNHVRIEALTHTDPLTGVANHRVLVDRLEQLLRRARRDPLLGGVLRVQVANLATIRGEYGREAAEAAMVRAAECVATEAVESDMVAREQGGDLVLLLEGKVSRVQATEAARNIIARGLKFSARLPPGVTLTLRVAGVCAPLRQGNAMDLLGVLAQVTQELSTDLLGRGLRIIEPASGD